MYTNPFTLILLVAVSAVPSHSSPIDARDLSRRWFCERSLVEERQAEDLLTRFNELYDREAVAEPSNVERDESDDVLASFFLKRDGEEADGLNTVRVYRRDDPTTLDSSTKAHQIYDWILKRDDDEEADGSNTVRVYRRDAPEPLDTSGMKTTQGQIYDWFLKRSGAPDSLLPSETKSQIFDWFLRRDGEEEAVGVNTARIHRRDTPVPLDTPDKETTQTQIYDWFLKREPDGVNPC